MKTVNFKNTVGAHPCGRPTANFSIRAFVMATVIGVVMASCGGRGGNQQSGTATETPPKGGTVAIKDATENNWQTAVKSNFSVDAAIPAGWTFNDMDAFNPIENNGYVTVSYLMGDGSTKVADIAKALFVQTAQLPGGNFALDENGKAKGKEYATFDELFTPDRTYDGITGINEHWYYTGADGYLRTVTALTQKGRGKSEGKLFMTIKFEISPVKL
jgi:hypothetical protein